MKKRIFSILLSLCMVMALMPQMVFGEEADYRITFEFDHGTLLDNKSPVTEPGSTVVDYYTMPSLDNRSYEPYVFLGWKIKGSNSSEVIPAGNKIAASNIKEDTTFVAVFKTVDITYEFDHGTLPADRQATETIEYGDCIDFPELENCGEYKLLGWQVKNSDDIEIYPNKEGAYYPSEDMTFVAVYDEIMTIKVPFTTKVELGGTASPGKTTFNLQVYDSGGDKLSSDDVKVEAESVTTNGAGSYDGTLTIKGTVEDIAKMLSDKVFVKQADVNDPDWTVDDAVWGLMLGDVVAMAAADDAVLDNYVFIFPAEYNKTEDGGYYEMIEGKDAVEKMSFTNIYTGTAVNPSDSESTANGASDSDSNTDAEGSAKTGDDSNLTLWLALLAVSAAGAVCTCVYSKRRRSSRAK